jgi:hypothetical protein
MPTIIIKGILRSVKKSLILLLLLSMAFFLYVLGIVADFRDMAVCYLYVLK